MFLDITCTCLDMLLAQLLDANGDNDDSDEDQEITHSVPFNCIGAAREKNYQHHLEQEYLLLDKIHQ